MNDPFSQHGVNYLSPSAINEFIANPQRWLLHVSGYRDQIGIPAMWRGIALDKALTRSCYEPTISNEQILQWAKMNLMIGRNKLLIQACLSPMTRLLKSEMRWIVTFFRQYRPSAH